MENNPHSKQVQWIPRSTLENDFSNMLNSKEYHDIKYAITKTGNFTLFKKQFKILNFL